MEGTRESAERRLYDEVTRLWNRHVTVATIAEAGGRPDTVTRLILKSIADHAPVRSSDAARELGLSRASISRRIAALEAAGFVATAPDPADGRASLLTLTPDGRARLQTLSDTGVDTVREVTSDFTDDEVATFADLLGRFNTKAANRLAVTMDAETHDQH